MSMDYASQSTATPTSGSDVVLSKPTGTVEGDVLVAFITVNWTSTPTITPPSGWTQVGTWGASGASSTHAGVWYKVAGASEPTSYTWTISTTMTDSGSAIVRYTPTAPTTPPGIIDAAAAGSTATPAVAPSVTTTGTGDTLIALFTASTAGSTPTGMTARVALDRTGAGAWIYDELLTTAGATGTRTWTGSSLGKGWVIALLADQAGNRVVMMV